MPAHTQFCEGCGNELTTDNPAISVVDSEDPSATVYVCGKCAASKAQQPKMLQWLAHFNNGSSQHVIATNKYFAVQKGAIAARSHGTSLGDITGPVDQIEE